MSQHPHTHPPVGCIGKLNGLISHKSMKEWLGRFALFRKPAARKPCTAELCVIWTTQNWKVSMRVRLLSLFPLQKLFARKERESFRDLMRCSETGLLSFCFLKQQMKENEPVCPSPQKTGRMILFLSAVRGWGAFHNSEFHLHFYFRTQKHGHKRPEKRIFFLCYRRDSYCSAVFCDISVADFISWGVQSNYIWDPIRTAIKQKLLCLNKRNI